MKIKYIIDTFLSPEIQALDWVGRYGGVVKTLYKEVKQSDNKTVIKRFPIACDATPVDCANQSIYQELTPDDAFKSVVYWEEVTPFTNIGFTQTKKFNERKFKGSARIVVWLNLAKLGINNCKDGALTIPSLEKILTKQGKIESGAFAGSNLWIIPKKIENQDINAVFGKYDYPKLKNFFAYPYDFYAIEVDFEMNQCLSNDTTLPVLPSIDCPNDLGVSDCDKILSLLNETLLLTCVLPTLDFSDSAVQNALSPQQKLDLMTWLLPEYDFTNPTWLNLLTNQQKTDLTNYLLPLVDFSDVSIQSLLTLTQVEQLTEWIISLVDFSDPSIQAIITPSQQEDLTAWLCQPPQRGAVAFDGVNEYFNSIYDANHEIERTDLFTIFAWVKISSYTTSWICSKYDQNIPRRGYFFRLLSDGRPSFTLANDVATNVIVIDGTTPIPLNTWTLIAVRSDGSSTAIGLEMFVNGALVDSTKTGTLTATTVSPTKTFKIGGNVAGGFFNGKIALVGLYKGVALSNSEMMDLMAIPYPKDTLHPANQIIWADYGSCLWYSTFWLVENKADTVAQNSFQSVLMEYVDRDTVDYPQ